MTPAVYAIATLDTKGEELAFVAECLRRCGVAVTTVDVGTDQPPGFPPDVSREDVLRGGTLQHGGDRGRAVTQMGAALAEYLANEERAGRVAGVIGLGGSGGTALITTALRRLPIGLPKLMVSTMASGDTSRYVDCSDITMVYSVVDVAGLNIVSERVLSNAAQAMAGMVSHKLPARDVKPCLGLTMFGVTTPCVTSARQLLEAEGYDCLVFHATGTGGRAMENLVGSGLICGVLDLTTTEVADEIAGGIFPAGEARFDVLVAQQIPLVVSLGAVDMVNFGPLDSVPARYRERNLHSHNSQITLMRTTMEENRQIARWIAGKLNRSTSPLVILIPEKGVSMLDAPGQPFHDGEADAVLFEELEAAIDQTPSRRIVRLPYHINDPEFSQAAVDEFLTLNAKSK